MLDIDDLFLINNDNFLKSHKHDIDPKELDLTSDDKDDQQVHFLDLDILIIGSKKKDFHIKFTINEIILIFLL